MYIYCYINTFFKLLFLVDIAVQNISSHSVTSLRLDLTYVLNQVTTSHYLNKFFLICVSIVLAVGERFMICPMISVRLDLLKLGCLEFLCLTNLSKKIFILILSLIFFVLSALIINIWNDVHKFYEMYRISFVEFVPL